MVFGRDSGAGADRTSSSSLESSNRLRKVLAAVSSSLESLNRLDPPFDLIVAGFPELLLKNPPPLLFVSFTDEPRKEVRIPIPPPARSAGEGGDIDLRENLPEGLPGWAATARS